MERFHIIPDAAAVISVGNGVFKQVDIFRRADGLYVGAAGGFVRLYGGGKSGHPKIRWDDMEVPGLTKAELKPDAFDKLSIPQGKLIEGAAGK